MDINEERLQALAQQLDRLQGALLATQIGVRSLVLLHADPEHAAQRLAHELDRWTAAALGSENSDDFVQAFDHARTRMLPSERDLQRSR